METRHPQIARLEQSLLVIVDCQDRLWKIIDGASELEARIPLLLRGAALLGVPALVTEQYPQGLGSTVSVIAEAAGEAPVVTKTTFSCWGEEAFRAAVRERDRTTLVLCGIETHVCVLQTALDALAAGFDVQVASDAVGSRFAANRETGLARLGAAGVTVTCVESLLFEWMERSDRDEFKAVSALLK